MLSLLIAFEEVIPMTSIIVRGLDESVKKQLARQAKKHGRSMEAEVRDILTKAARRPHIGMALMQAAQEAGGVDELSVPERTDTARAVDFG
jgi:antitoxin FitA